jgi:hypothetical protein
VGFVASHPFAEKTRKDGARDGFATVFPRGLPPLTGLAYALLRGRLGEPGVFCFEHACPLMDVPDLRRAVHDGKPSYLWQSFSGIWNPA